MGATITARAAFPRTLSRVLRSASTVPRVGVCADLTSERLQEARDDCLATIIACSSTTASPFPTKELKFTFSRSSGPGGQNVNRSIAKQRCIGTWWKPLPAGDVRQRFRTQFKTRISQAGDVVLYSQQYRDSRRTWRPAGAASGHDSRRPPSPQDPAEIETTYGPKSGG